jgi:hypothetical protein
MKTTNYNYLIYILFTLILFYVKKVNMNTNQDQPTTQYTARLRYYNIEYDVRFVLNTRNNYNIIFQDYELKKHRKNANTSVNYRCKQGFKCSASVTIYKNQITHLVTKHSDLCLKYNEIRYDFNNNASNAFHLNQINHQFSNVNSGFNGFNSLIINPYQQYGYDFSMFQSFHPNQFNNLNVLVPNGSVNTSLNCGNIISSNNNNNFCGSSDVDESYF